ncbi:hypothetical protein Sango_0968900 [Sesamum angolense]|uniref:Uncharacterized protein n=1 Tax=Sesamum angolense TaxID=2727404 RepID=A0AAE1WZY7_9LAMI|nr:hypothetical protein Sango_0968900 [Sesamum angolense]
MMDMESWVITMNQRAREISRGGEEQRNRKRAYIYRLPAYVHIEQGDFVYRPYKVSFGPYYHGHESCQPKEVQKESCLIQFLARSGRPLEYFVDALADNVEDLKNAYDKLDRYWEDDTEAFLRLMILDGCFLIQILRAGCAFFYEDVSDRPELGTDEISVSEMEYYVHDMLLLENQLPMLVLEMLFSAENDYNRVTELILKFLSLLGTPVLRKEDTEREGMHLHVLDLYRRSLLNPEFRLKEKREKTRMQFGFNMGKKRRPQTGVDFNIPSATELHQAGMGFTTSKKTSLMDISFGRRTLKLPQISLDNVSKSSFLNIIAFEQLHKGAGNEFTSYIHFMGSLLQDSNDVSLLQSRGIIRTTLRRDEVAELFSRLRRNTVINPDKMLAYEYWTVARRVRLRFNKMSNEWRRDLFQTYLRSPWAIISVIAAILIFILTIIQTVYAVLSYVNRK